MAAGEPALTPAASLGLARGAGAAPLFFGYAPPVRIDFTKMHALGNDFMILEPPPGGVPPIRAQWRALADRHTGVGFDQALGLEPPRSAASHTYYRIYTADGSEAGQCGNGARCIARYLRMRDRDAPATLRMGSAGGEIEARLLADGLVAVDLGAPEFQLARVPFLAPTMEATYSMEVAGGKNEFCAVSMGHPPPGFRVAAVEKAHVGGIGAAPPAHPRLSQPVERRFFQNVVQP